MSSNEETFLSENGTFGKLKSCRRHIYHLQHFNEMRDSLDSSNSICSLSSYAELQRHSTYRELFEIISFDHIHYKKLWASFAFSGHIPISRGMHLWGGVGGGKTSNRNLFCYFFCCTHP